MIKSKIMILSCLYNTHVSFVVHCRLCFCTDFTFAQMATGPGSVCKGGNATFSCEIVNAGGVIQPNQWRFPNDIVINFNTPHHTLVLDTATSLVSDLIVTDINERAVYVCSLAAKPELVSRVYINAEGMYGHIYVCVYSMIKINHNISIQHGYFFSTGCT